VVDLVEARFDVCLEHPLVVSRGRAEVVDLRDRVLRSASWAEAIGTWLEVRLEDRLEHQFQRGLHDPIGDSRDPQPADLAAGFGNRLLPRALRREPTGLEILSQPVEQRPSAEHDGAGNHSIDASSSCTLVAPHPTPRHNEERRVIHEVEHIIEATARISLRPSVQLRLHHAYPLLGLVEVRPRCADIHRRPPRSALMPRTRWTPSPCDRLSRPRTTTGPPPHPGSINWRRVFPPTSRLLAGEGTAEMVPTFTLEPFDGVGAQLCPCNIATATPQAFTVASEPARLTDPRVPRTTSCGYALLPSPDPPGWSWWVS